jgi:hypothetical protein
MRAVWRLWKLAILGEFPRTSHDTAGLDGGTVHYFTCRSICGLLERSGFDIAGLYGIHCRPRWMEHRARTPFGRGVKREFFSGEVLVDARVASLQAPARSLL